MTNRGRTRILNDRRRRHPRDHPRAAARRARAAGGQARCRALRPDRRHLDRRHPRLRADHPRRRGPPALACRGAGGALRAGGPAHLRPLAAQADHLPRGHHRRALSEPAAARPPAPLLRRRPPAQRAHARARPRVRDRAPHPVVLPLRAGAGRSRLRLPDGRRRLCHLGRADVLRAGQAARAGRAERLLRIDRRRRVRGQPGHVRVGRGAGARPRPGHRGGLARDGIARAPHRLRRREGLGPDPMGPARARRGLRRLVGRRRLPARPSAGPRPAVPLPRLRSRARPTTWTTRVPTTCAHCASRARTWSSARRRSSTRP
jgi:hypothetical protein